MKAPKIPQRVYYLSMSLSKNGSSVKSSSQKARASKAVPSKVRSARISLKKMLIRVQELNKSKDQLTLNWFRIDRKMINCSSLTERISSMVGLLHSEQSLKWRAVSRKVLFQRW